MASSNDNPLTLASPDADALSAASSMLDLAKSDDSQPTSCVNSEVILSDSPNRSGDLNNPSVHSVQGDEYNDPKNKLLPRRLIPITYPDPSQPESEMEVCRVGDSGCAQVSVIKAELDIGSDGAEKESYLFGDQSSAGAEVAAETPVCNDNTRIPEVMDTMPQVDFPMHVPPEAPTFTNLVAITPNYIPSSAKSAQTKRSPRGRKPSNVGSKLNKVVSKLILAKSNTSESESNPSILHTLLRNSPLNELESPDNQCLQTPDVSKLPKKTASKLLPPVVPEPLRLPSELLIIPSMTVDQIDARDAPVNVCDNLPKIPNCTIPSPVVNRLRKLGTIVEVENASSVKKTDIASRFTELFDSMAQADNILSDLTKKKKKKTTKKVQEDHKVPSVLPSENADTEKFYFQVDKTQVMELQEGQKLYTCDICSGVYHRGFSLKRHYIKTHINSKHVSARDLHNCGIIIDKSAVENGAKGRPKIDSPPIVSNLSQPKNIPDLYRCHNCSVCFPDKNELKVHLMDHPPVSLETINEKQFSKTYRCEVCLLHFQKKKQYLRHLESCNQELQTLTYHCLYCEKSFPSFDFKKNHQLKMHHPKKRLHACYICKMKMFKDRSGLFKHLIVFHRDEYFGCLLCKMRFTEKSELKKHKKEKHVKEKKQELPNKSTKTDIQDNALPNQDDSKEEYNFKCTFCAKTFNDYVSMNRHCRLAHTVPNKKNKKDNKIELHADKVGEPSSPISHLTRPPNSVVMDPETMFYSRISLNIRENLLHHLDGKLDSQEVLEYDLKPNSSSQINRNKLLNFSASFTSAKGSLEKDNTVLNKDDIRPSHLTISPKVPWEKFNFPKNYDGRCGLTSYIKDMSHLDIATQLTMRRNLQRFNCSLGQEINKEVVNEDIPSGLSLERQGAACAETYGDPDSSTVKNLEGMPELSGEWIRPRTYICAACGLKSNSLWEIEDHKASLHPNVWCPHVEVVGEQSSVWDWVYYRSLPTQNASGAVTSPLFNKTLSPPKCTKCLFQSSSIPDMHRHMLECGGDTTWMSTMLAVTSPGSRRSRKWRPFGSRRRRQQGRRGMKRNIPNTPAKHVCGKIRTKPGDTDTIQKMIANLPPKRVTRKVIDEIDIKTRSQATINSVPFNVFTYTNKPPSLNGKTSKAGKHSNNQKTASGNGKKSKNNENSENKKEDNGKKVTKTESSGSSYTDEDNGTDFVKLEDVAIQKIEAEVMVQHSDILTSLQMIPVVRKEVLEDVKETDEPIETETVLAAMRVAMDAAADVPAEKVFKKKGKDKKKKESGASDDLIICNGCGMQFDHSSACQRHKKKCVYWKQEISMGESNTNKCAHCNTVFPYLMALLTHDCKLAKVGEELAMPELSREEPVDEIKTEDVEDIPILSPEDMKVVRKVLKHDKEERAKRLSLLERTIGEVANESFVIEEFHLKAKIGFYRPEDVVLDKGGENTMDVEQTKQNVTQCTVEEITSSPVKLEQNELVEKKKKFKGDSPKKVSPKQSSPKEDIESHTKLYIKKKKIQTNTNKINSKSKTNSTFVENKVDKIKKGKMSRFKGRTKKSFKGKLLVRSAIPHKAKKNNIILKRKMKVIARKRRSTNLDLLLKESEKLGEDGALAFGRRRRQDSINSVDFKFVEVGEVAKKKPGRPKKIKELPVDPDKVEVKTESAGETSEDIKNTPSKVDKECISVTKVKPKFKLNALDRKTGKVIKYNSENSVKDSKMRQTNLDEMFEKSPVANETSVKEQIKTNAEVEKKEKGRPKMKQTTLDLIREKTPIGKADNQKEKSKVISPKSNSTNPENKTKNIDNLQLETSSQTKVIFLSGEPKVKSKVKNNKMTEIKEEQENEDFIEDPDEIPLSRVKNEHLEINENNKLKEGKKCSNVEECDTYLTGPTKRKKRTSPIKNGLKLKSNTSTKTKENKGKFSDKGIAEDSVNTSEENSQSSVKSALVSNIKTKGKNQKIKKAEDNKAKLIEDQEQISSQASSKTSDDLEWDTIHEVVTNYGCEEIPVLGLNLKKKPRGRSSPNKYVKKEGTELETILSKKKKGNKKKRSTDESERETIEMVVNAANIVDINDYKSENVSDVINVEDPKSNEAALKKIEASTGEKSSDEDDLDEDESLISLKRKLQSAKEGSINGDEQTKKKPCLEIIESSTGESDSKSSINFHQEKSHSKVTKKFKKVNRVTTKFSKVPKNSKKFKTIDSSFSGESLNSSKIAGVKEKIKKKKKIKLKKILKNVNFDMTEVTVKKVTKRNMLQSEQVLKKLPKFNDKLFKKLKKKHKFGVAGSKWEVSVVDSTENLSKCASTNEGSIIPQEEKKEDLVSPNPQYYCNTCDENFPSSYGLYEHQLTASHKNKQSSKEQPKGIEMCCNTLANVLSDLEKKTLQVAKVMNQLKHRESTDSISEDLRNTSTSNVSDVPNLMGSQCIPKKEQSEVGAGDAWVAPPSQSQEWSQDWSMIRPTTPHWDNQHQPWENESNFSSGCGSSLGSILDTVNKILTEQEVSTQPAGLPQYTMADLQKAMGASDEEMAMLEQLGEGSLQEDYVYDNSRPGAEVWPKEEGPTFMDLDNQEPNVVTAASSSQDAIVPVEPRSVTPFTETESEMRQCRGLLGRPRRLLNDYEMREMVCPTCNKHFLGLSALQTHVAWSHCAPVHNSARSGGGLKRRALLNGCEEIDRRLVCFVCKEIVSSSNQLDIHIQAQHMKKTFEGDKGSPNKEEGAEKLKSKMSNALGGLLDRALNNLLGAKHKNAELIDPQPELNSGALQLLGKLCAVRRRVGNENMKISGDTLKLLGRLRAAKNKEDANAMKLSPSFAKELRQVISRATSNAHKVSGVNKANLSASVTSEAPANPDVKPTNLLDHLAVCSNDVEQRPYACPICDVRFLIPSTRNRHIARAHGKYGRKYDEEVQEQIQEQLALDACSNCTDDPGESDWRDFFPTLDENNFDGESEMNPLCSDCGLSFQSIHDVIKHRKEDHPRRFSADVSPEDNPVPFKDEIPMIEAVTQPSSSSTVVVIEPVPVNTLPVSDNAVDSTSNLKKRRGRPPKIETITHTLSGDKQGNVQSDKKNLCKKTGRKKKMEGAEEEEISDGPEIQSSEITEESDTNSRSAVDDKLDEIINNVDDEFDNLFIKGNMEYNSNDKKKDDHTVLAKKNEKRKSRLSFMGEEAVRVKAEAALKELNQPRKNKSLVSSARWGVNALRFVKNTSPNSESSSSTTCFTTSKVRFASLSDKKFKGSSSDDGTPIKTEKLDTLLGLDEKSDIYDFNDDDLLAEKKPFSPLKDLQEVEKKLALPEDGNSVGEKCKQKLNDS